VDEAKSVVSLIRGSGFGMQTGHVPMMGFQVSWKSLDFGFSEGNNRVPRFKDLPLILEAVKGEVFQTLHYYTKRPDRLLPELDRVLAHENIYEAGLVGGVQINRAFPEPREIKALKDAYPELKIVLQVYPKEDSVAQLAEQLAREYGELDYIIVDYSHGTGTEFDARQVTATYRALRDAGVGSGITFAGGFSGENVRLKAHRLVEAVGTRDFSIDAEGGLRDRAGEGYGNDMLNLGKVESFLRGSFEELVR
jgi:hypothetical protein